MLLTGGMEILSLPAGGMPSLALLAGGKKLLKSPAGGKLLSTDPQSSLVSGIEYRRSLFTVDSPILLTIIIRPLTGQGTIGPQGLTILLQGQKLPFSLGTQGNGLLEKPEPPTKLLLMYRERRRSKWR